MERFIGTLYVVMVVTCFIMWLKTGDVTWVMLEVAIAYTNYRRITNKIKSNETNIN